jgi:hypothetical protein
MTCPTNEIRLPQALRGEKGEEKGKKKGTHLESFAAIPGYVQ